MILIVFLRCRVRTEEEGSGEKKLRKRFVGRDGVETRGG